MFEIRVTTQGGDDKSTWHVEVVESATRTRHEVHVTHEDVARYAGAGVAPARLVEESFRFLLEREPKEAILARFDLPVIERYFPEYGKEIRRRLGT